MSPQLRLFPQKSLLGCHFHVSLSISTRNLWQFPFKKGCHFLFLVAKSAIILGNRSKKLSIYSSSFKATLIFCELFWEVFLNVSNHLKIGIKSDKIVNFKVTFKNYVDASTPKLGEWAERWDSREPCTGGITIPKPLFYCTGFARIPAFGPLSKFGGGRLYLDLLSWVTLWNLKISLKLYQHSQSFLIIIDWYALQSSPNVDFPLILSKCTPANSASISVWPYHKSK